MKRTWNLLGGLLSLLLIGIVLVGLVLILSARARPLGSRPFDSPPQTATSAVSPPPATLTPRASAAPPTTTSTPTRTRPAPTTITFWTLTPRPTPTRRPEPTATIFPTRGPAPNAAGTILYTLSSQHVIMGLPMDEQGKKATEATPLPLSVDFSPILGPHSPDGRYLMLLRPVEPAGLPYVYDQQTKQTWRPFDRYAISQDVIGWPYAWHANSYQVLFWFFNNEEIWLANVKTGEYTVLALTEGPVQGAAISPSGQDIVYIERSGLRELMWKVSAAGSDARPLFDLGGPSYVFGWSPDGSYILYAGGASGDPKDAAISTPMPGGPLWLADPTGQIRRPLSGHFLFGWGLQPVWSPDSQWIAFTGADTGRPFGCTQKEPRPDPATCLFAGTAVYIENIRTGEVRRLASGIEPIWSPDGSILAFLSNQSNALEIWTIKVDGTGLCQLTTDAQLKGWRLTWSPARR